MNRQNSSQLRTFGVLPCILLVLIFIPGCSQPPQRTAGPGDLYAQAKDDFDKANFDKAIEHTESLAKGSPPNEFTDRARVMRVIIYGGEMRGYKEMVDAYNKGLDVTKNSLAKSTFGAKRHDDLQSGGQSAIYLAQVAHLLTDGGKLPNDLTLDLPYPITEGPTSINQLSRVMDGGMVGTEDLDAATTDAVRKGVDEMLADVLGGDRAQARSTLKSGTAKLDTYKFSVFLARELLKSAILFDRKHVHDPQKYRILCTEADEAANIAQATLKESPDKARAKDVKKLQDDIKAGLKNL